MPRRRRSQQSPCWLLSKCLKETEAAARERRQNGTCCSSFGQSPADWSTHSWTRPSESCSSRQSILFLGKVSSPLTNPHSASTSQAQSQKCNLQVLGVAVPRPPALGKRLCSGKVPPPGLAASDAAKQDRVTSAKAWARQSRRPAGRSARALRRVEAREEEVKTSMR